MSNYVNVLFKVEQLEVQIKELTNRITELETENNNQLSELNSSEDKIGLLRDIILNLETQIETKASQEMEVLKDLDLYRMLSEERELKIDDLTEELKASRNDIEKRITEGLLDANSKKQAGGAEGEVDSDKLEIEEMRNEVGYNFDCFYFI